MSSVDCVCVCLSLGGRRMPEQRKPNWLLAFIINHMHCAVEFLATLRPQIKNENINKPTNENSYIPTVRFCFHRSESPDVGKQKRNQSVIGQPHMERGRRASITSTPHMNLEQYRFSGWVFILPVLMPTHFQSANQNIK